MNKDYEHEEQADSAGRDEEEIGGHQLSEMSLEYKRKERPEGRRL